MKTALILYSLLYTCSIGLAQEKEIPSWFKNDLEQNIGKWETDNKDHFSENEPFDTYGIEWVWGIGKTSIIGRLYGKNNGKEVQTFWQFRQYWDNRDEKAIIVQFGLGGSQGEGEMKLLDNGDIQSIQIFSLPSGSEWVEKHISRIENDTLITINYLKEKKKWTEKRTYIWAKISEKP